MITRYELDKMLGIYGFKYNCKIGGYWGPCEEIIDMNELVKMCRKEGILAFYLLMIDIKEQVN